jgi:voltage-gated potassium channel
VKFLTTLIATMSAPSTEASRRAIVRLVVVLGLAVVLFSVGFRWLMALEGQEFSWLASFYWVMVTMTTLGYGDIVFTSDLGRMYSLLVLVAGAILILVMLPFTFIQVVYLPWQTATRRARAPRELPEGTQGHVILTGLDPMNEVLIDRLTAARVPYVLLVDDVDEGVRLHDEGYRVAVGALDDPATYRNLRADRAAMMLTARNDRANTNAAFTMREVTDAGLVVATASSPDAVDILELAGCDRVLQLGVIMGTALARRILAPTARCSVIAEFADLRLAETSTAGTELVGRTLRDLDLRERFGVSVVGVWDRGTMQAATPEREITERSILVLAGSAAALRAYDGAFASGPLAGPAPTEHVVIIGGGRVGRAAAAALQEGGTSCTVVERLAERVQHLPGAVVGDAADIEVLREAGIERASAVVVTTHDDDMNLYLTLYCRRLRPEALILGRVNLDRNLVTMHRAGADLVLSYASLGAAEAWNALRPRSTLLIAEGLVAFRAPVPRALAGRTLRQADLPAATGSTVIGVGGEDHFETELDLDAPLPADGELLLVGGAGAEDAFWSRYAEERGGLARRALTRLRSGSGSGSGSGSRRDHSCQEPS